MRALALTNTKLGEYEKEFDSVVYLDPTLDLNTIYHFIYMNHFDALVVDELDDKVKELLSMPFNGYNYVIDEFNYIYKFFGLEMVPLDPMVVFGSLDIKDNDFDFSGY